MHRAQPRRTRRHQTLPRHPPPPPPPVPGLGHTTEALHALNETMRLAQQCADPSSMLQALALLCRLLAATAPGAPGLPPHGPAALRSGQVGPRTPPTMT